MILAARSLEELEEIKLQLLGRSGTLTVALKEMSKVPAEQKPEVGRVVNEVKTIIEDTLANRQKELKQFSKWKLDLLSY